MIWYIADLYLARTAIIGHCGRPFATSGHMDDALVANLAGRVASDDDLYVVGDFALGGGSGHDYVLRRFDEIPSRKHLVVGNHDASWMREIPWESVSDVVEVKDGGQRVFLCHYPMITWPGARRGALHLFGHVHGNWQGSRNAVNVGVDVWDFQPVTLRDAQRRAGRLPIDKHWEEVEPRAESSTRWTRRSSAPRSARS